MGEVYRVRPPPFREGGLLNYLLLFRPGELPHGTLWGCTPRNFFAAGDKSTDAAGAVFAGDDAAGAGAGFAA